MSYRYLYDYAPAHIKAVVNAGINTLMPGARETWEREHAYWTSPRGEFELMAGLSALPFGIGDMFRSIYSYQDDMKEADAYLDMIGLSWEDIKYPSRTRAFNSGGSVARAGVNFISSNVNRLYS